jgi:prepilin-type N-terminal cleavage/methylation domain-containing protein
MTRSKGFTLIEMITVLTIILIVLAIAIPVWNALLGGTNLAAAQNQITAFLANARADAIYNRQTIGVCFFIDPNSQQTAMAEVQVQTLYNGTTNTPLFTPRTPSNNGSVYSLEYVNNADPNTPGNYIFYRDIVLLPKGVGVALNNNTYTYNPYGVWTPTSGPPTFDRYLRTGVIMFNSDGSLASIPFGIPVTETFPGAASAVTNLLCQRIGMQSSSTVDFASNVSAPGTPPPPYPLISSVGLVVFDSDTYLNQRAAPTSKVTTADDAQFSNLDMNYVIDTAAYPGGTYQSNSADKFLEESWIDQNGTAYLVSPFNGSLIRAK